MKYEKLKKQVLVETSIIAIVLVVMGAVIFLISSVLSDYEESNQVLQKPSTCTTATIDSPSWPKLWPELKCKL